MSENIDSIINESIILELNISDLYLLFNSLFPQDSNFWWQLTLEEKNHAALIRSGKEFFVMQDIFPDDILDGSFEELKNTNNYLLSLIKKYKATTPTREIAFNTAHKIENSAGELHYQLFLEKEAKSKADTIFQKLNNDDRDHAIRIRSYMKKNGIPIHFKENYE